jgi:aminomethyltransferase
MVPFAGYEMPVQYAGVLDETKAVRATGGLFDVSHMGQFSVRGKGSLQAVQPLVTNDLGRLSLGQAQYNMLCNERGGVIDDIIVYRRSDDETYLCVNASNRRTDFEWMQSRIPRQFSFTDESDETALLALQGPQAKALLAHIADEVLVGSLKYYWAAEAKVLGHPCYVSRTGYTGEDGFELYLRNEDAIDVWESLLETGRKMGVVPCGLGSRDTLRLEMGYPLHGHELSPEITPLQAGLGWVVKLNTANEFIGKSALVEESERGPEKLLRAFKVRDRRIARQGYRIYDKKQNQIGEVTSGTQSPHLSAPISLGFVSREAADFAQVFIQVREEMISADVVKLPFVAPSTKKATQL